MFWKKKSKEAKPSREAILRQAQADMAAKRTEIGEQTLDHIRQAIAGHENSALEKAKKQIFNADEDKVRDHIDLWLKE